MIYTTLNRIREHSPCAHGWRKLLAHLGKTQADDEPLSFATILESNGLEDALWCCRVEPQYAKEWRLFAVECARRVQHLMHDPWSLAALDVAERYAHGLASDEELRAARCAAADAARSASQDEAWGAARGAAWGAAWDAAADAAAGAARGAAWGAAWDAAWGAAAGAAWDAAYDTALDAARKEQSSTFLKYVTE